MTQAFIKLLAYTHPLAGSGFDRSKQTLASIVYVAGMGGGKFGERASHQYGLARTQLEAFTKTVAKENGSRGVRCNAVWPSMINSSNRQAAAAAAQKGGIQASATSLKRAGRPDEVASLVLFLASDSSSFITASCIDIDGGL